MADEIKTADAAVPTERAMMDAGAMGTLSTREQAAVDLVNAWFEAHCRHGAVARVTDAYNQMFDAMPDLVKRILALE